MSTTIIGGADGPTTIFLAGKLPAVNWINIYGFILMAMILMPNIVYAKKNPNKENRCTNRWMNLLEEVGRYASMILMCFHIGVGEFGFATPERFVIYLLGNVLLLIVYRLTWGLYFHEEKLKYAMILAITPTMIFILSGVTLGHVLLAISGVLFGIGHIYVTYVNHK